MLSSTPQLGFAWMALAVPAIGQGVGVALAKLFGRRGATQRRATTDIVNELEPILRANLDAYLTGSRSAEAQRQAIANYDQAWAWLQDQCGQTTFGEPGRACIGDRARGGRWDWFALYRDPIAATVTERAGEASELPTEEYGAAPWIAVALIAAGVLL